MIDPADPRPSRTAPDGAGACSAPGADDRARPGPWWPRLVLGAVLAAGLAGFFLAGGPQALSFQTLSAHHADIADWVAEHRLAAAAAFVTVYIAAVSFSVPGAVWLSITGGYLFGPATGTVLIVSAATAGATAVFLAARYVLGDGWRRRVGGAMARLERGLRKNAFSTLLVLRLVPLFPFWLVNLVPAFLGIRVRTYVAATALGIIPGAAVFASVGNGLDAVLEAGDRPDPGILYDPEIFLPLLGLAALAMIGPLYRWRAGRSS